MCRRLRKTFLEIVVFKMGLKKERGFYQVEMEDKGYLPFHMYSLCLSLTHTHAHAQTHIFSYPFIHPARIIIQILIYTI